MKIQSQGKVVRVVSNLALTDCCEFDSSVLKQQVILAKLYYVLFLCSCQYAKIFMFM